MCHIKEDEEHTVLSYETNLPAIWPEDVATTLMEGHPAIPNHELGDAQDRAKHVSVLKKNS